MVQLNSCCQVVKMVSAGEDGLMGGGGFLTYNCAYIVLPRSFKTTYISIKPTRPTTKALWLIVHI